VIRVLIVDDERPARDGIRVRLEQATGFDVVAEAGTGRAAIEAVEAHAPDLMFLDIRLPDLDGFEVLRGIPTGRRPHVIFVTAYDRHAIQAFEIHALDYLLKPITPRRFADALDHARTAHASHLAARTLDQLSHGLRGDSTAEVPDDRSNETGPLERLLVRERSRTRVVRVADIQWIRSCGNYVTIRTGEREMLHRVTIARLAGRLPPRTFARIHRTAIVNIDAVAEIHPLTHGDYEVQMRDGATLRMSRRYRSAFR
jgi:two-component system, LytTR family, response regulator